MTAREKGRSPARGVTDRKSQVKRRSGGKLASSHGIAFNASALREARLSEYGVRFVLGAAISLVAGLVGMKFGPRVGGVFLAFPAILPAALTLLEKHEGEGAADADAQGGILGGLGLLGFAVVVATLTRALGAPIALALALAAWAIIATGLYVVLRAAWPGAWR